MTKVKTGIKGFDELVEGGLPQGKVVLLSGAPGTGKTIFALQYLYNGAVHFNEKGIYVSFEEPADALRRQAKQFGWDFEKLEREKKVKIVSIPVRSIKENTAEEILELARKMKASRIVIDSLNALSINSPTTYTAVNELTEISIQRFMYLFINEMRDSEGGITPLLISQTLGNQVTRDTVSEFICDGIIHMTYEPMGGKYTMFLTIRKMRETRHNEDIHPIEISDEGLVTHTLQLG